ncbi:MAG: AI-2E family transporter [Acidobacteria bacterium]|nr:AI-2E family transporter [Acidobacteriota bacterium]MCI0567012.1 AI-2E family transporter [Acidobacteriota bacterium]
MTSPPTRFISLGIVILLSAMLVVGLKSYLSAILAALVFAPIFRPVYLRIISRVKSPTIAAWVTLLIILMVAVGPLVTVGVLATQEVQTLAQQYQQLSPDKINLTIFGRNIPDLVREGAAKFLDWLQSSLGAIASGTLRVVVGVFVMFYLTYYLLREQDRLEQVIKELLPFDAKNSQKLMDDFYRISRGFVLGQGLTALLQGALGAIGFLIFGFPGAFLWGLVMAALSLIPVLGAFLIWVPAGILQIASGATISGVGILIWGAVVVSCADNLVRPLIMKNMAGVHPVITLLGVFAGLSLFGFIGIVVGPLLFAMVLETARMFYREQAESS